MFDHIDINKKNIWIYMIVAAILFIVLSPGTLITLQVPIESGDVAFDTATWLGGNATTSISAVLVHSVVFLFALVAVTLIGFCKK